VLLPLGVVAYPALTISEESKGVYGPEYVLTCIGVKDIMGTAYDNDFALELTENWNDALTSMSDEYSLENNDIHNFSLPPVTLKYPTNGSDILITLTGVPTNVGVYAGDPIDCVGSPTTAWNYSLGCDLYIDPAVPISKTAPYGTTQPFWYKIETTDVRAVEWAIFPFHLWSKGPLPPNQNYMIQAIVQLTDMYPTDSYSAPPNGDMPWFSEVEPPSPFMVVEFIDCVTKLLFPYVNTFNGGGTKAFSHFDTGIAIANTTVDPFALETCTVNALTNPNGLCYPDEAVGSAVPQNGSCTFYFYPASGAAPIVWTTGVINAGTSAGIDVAATVPGIGTFGTGYAIAICDFQNAHAFTEIWDNAGLGDPGVIVSYMAEVLPEPAFYHRSPAGDGLGEGAVAPINIDGMLLRMLMGQVRHHHK